MHRPRVSSLAAGLGVLLASAAADPASAATTCAFNSAAATVTVTMGASGDSAGIGRTGGGVLTVNGATCSGATVTNVNTIRVVTSGDGTQTAAIDIGNGPLGPGKTAETVGTSEIELDVNLGLGSSDTLHVLGRDVADTLRIGTLGAALNIDADPDVTYSGIDQFRMRGRDGADILSTAGGGGTGDPVARYAELFGGAGGDTLTGGRAGDVLEGDSEGLNGTPTGLGNDRLYGGPGGDRLKGHAGNDTLEGQAGYDDLYLEAGVDIYRGGSEGDDFYPEWTQAGPADGADAISGGTGYDKLDLSGRTGHLVITLDGVANDGADLTVPANGTAEEGDNVGADVESVETGTGNDRLSADTPSANAAAIENRLDGNAGNDVLAAGEGADVVISDAGADQITGGAGDDDLYGGTEVDTIRGGDGDDDITAGPGADSVFGDDGDERFYEEFTNDGADTVAGGTGRDYISYSRATDTRVTLDNLANDGEDAQRDGVAEEKDNVRSDVEDVRAGSGFDFLSANFAAANAAGAGNHFDAGTGTDTLFGGAGEDELHGGGGPDRVVGGAGEDLLYGEEGVDRFEALDGFFDSIDGGFDADTDVVANADSFDSRVRVP